MYCVLACLWGCVERCRHATLVDRGSILEPRRGHNLYLLLDHMTKHWWSKCFTLAPFLPPQFGTLRRERNKMQRDLCRRIVQQGHTFHSHDGGTYTVSYHWVLLRLGKLHTHTDTHRHTHTHNYHLIWLVQFASSSGNTNKGRVCMIMTCLSLLETRTSTYTYCLIILGNTYLHAMTSTKRYNLFVNLTNWEGSKRWASYSNFRIGNFASDYKLESLGDYIGNNGESPEIIILYLSSSVCITMHMSTRLRKLNRHQFGTLLA